MLVGFICDGRRHIAYHISALIRFRHQPFPSSHIIIISGEALRRTNLRVLHYFGCRLPLLEVGPGEAWTKVENTYFPTAFAILSFVYVTRIFSFRHFFALPFFYICASHCRLTIWLHILPYTLVFRKRRAINLSSRLLQRAAGAGNGLLLGIWRRAFVHAHTSIFLYCVYI
ncbi:hypothetical protein EJ04DRAFT_50602 [Polyplosphaeria fusca]|uniref:Uncharacterized protein n=1 Tax=Polyplosphaeria fusca TaxID=682080 RepID=A0A9P4UYQ5_9PLEO|nr:hypothetical protein EJ04DRAFT_50602 [Polyplosphaeria fusca]